MNNNQLEKNVCEKDLSTLLTESPSQSQMSTKTLSPTEYELYCKMQSESKTIRINDSVVLNISEFHAVLSEALDKCCEKVRNSDAS